jgi:hypothetical protein
MKEREVVQTAVINYINSPPPPRPKRAPTMYVMKRWKKAKENRRQRSVGKRPESREIITYQNGT